MKVKIKLLREGTPIPEYQRFGDAGLDLVNMGKPVLVRPFERALIPTGLACAIPYGYELQIRPRSGLALKRGISLLNSPGTVDAGYRGEIGVIVYNSSGEEVIINHLERVAQAILSRFENIEWELSQDLDNTERGDGGFGSTGR